MRSQCNRALAQKARRGMFLAVVVAALCLPAEPAAASPYPAGARRPAKVARAFEFAHASRAVHKKPSKHKSKKPKLPVNVERAQLAFAAMQNTYYIPGSGLYEGEPFSFLWPFSQALAATVSMANIPSVKSSFAHEVKVRLVGLRSYLDTNNSGAPEGTFTSTLAGFDGTVAPPAGPGGTKYYDDNEWVGIELMRIYEQTHEAAVLGTAEGIMAFEMASWKTAGPEGQQIACPGGIPFSNAAENRERNTITDAPAAELGVQLYRLTSNPQYLQFAEMAYEWVRNCLTAPNGLYGDHIYPNGAIDSTEWSYNQGTMIGAGVLLYQATGNSYYLYQARQTAKAALAYFTPERLGSEIPFFPSVYFRNMLYLDSVTHDPPGLKLVQGYVNYAWEHLRLSDGVFVAGSPATAQLLVQAAIVQDYALLSSPPATFF
ncbi:MAG: glycoside hydrolase family 76 protein [Solirubrobacterales bacterium]